MDMSVMLILMGNSHAFFKGLLVIMQVLRPPTSVFHLTVKKRINLIIAFIAITISLAHL